MRGTQPGLRKSVSKNAGSKGDSPLRGPKEEILGPMKAELFVYRGTLWNTSRTDKALVNQ